MIVRENNYEGKSPLLYLVATPIGNLSEFPPRAVDILKSMDYVACEDTRNSGLLLQRFSIDKPLISCHEHNEETAADKIVALLKSGKKVAYVSDAGYPVVSDPGNRLAERCIAAGIKVAVINGPSAGICALVGSGLPADHFYFHGFLSAKPNRTQSGAPKSREPSLYPDFL
jgi:16S rRNA (cytidine1402-2'-O)-methyltransferase